MRKYQLISSDGMMFNVFHIGVNHLANGSKYGGKASSYDKAFDNEDEIGIENGLDEIRYCKIGNAATSYRSRNGVPTPRRSLPRPLPAR